MIVNQEWLDKQYFDEESGKPLSADNSEDGYVLAILNVGKKALVLMELLPEDQPIDARALVNEADKILDEGITGNMAAYIALIATKCHSRGEEFRKSWNTQNGNPDSKGVVNPAVMHIG